MEGISKQIILFVVFISLLLNLALAQQENSDTNSQGNCVVRDGRDGVQGPPGAPGLQGSPGRDGRDCTISWSLQKVFEMEKRLHELDSKCQFVVKEAAEMKKELGTSKQQAQELLRILADKNILDADSLVQQVTYDIFPTPGEVRRKTDIALRTNKPITFTTTPPVYSTATESSTTEQNCQKRLIFHVYDQIETKGAVNMEPFVINGSMFLAVSNFHFAPDGYNTQSFIYKMNPLTEKFELLQTLPTIGCRSMTYFDDDGDSYLVAMNHFDGQTHALNSVIYKWNGTKFVDYKHVKTQGGSAAQFFQIDGESFLTFANYRNTTSVSIFSIVYKWNQGELEVFQELPTHGAVDCKFYHSKIGEKFLVFANYYRLNEGFNVKSAVHKWNGERFVFVQNVEASAAIGIDMFDSDHGLFLALASHRTVSSWHSHTNVFRWNGTEFALFQELETTAAIKVHHFVSDGTLYLTVANYFDEITDFETHSMVYKYKNDRFVKFQGIQTTGAYDLQPFNYGGFPYLAAAFRFDGNSGNLQSKIYKMFEGCPAKENVLP